MTIVRLMVAAALILIIARTGFAQEGESRTLTMPRQGVPLGESVEMGSVSPSAISLTLPDAIQRALRTNLAVLTGTQEARAAEAVYLKDLSELRPTINTNLSMVQQQVSLAAFGFTGVAGVPPIIGPFQVLDARANFSQRLFDLQHKHDALESAANRQAVQLSNQNIRELVVLTVMDLYFQAVSGASRIRAIEAQVARAQTLFERATDLKNAGLTPGIDVLRAQVELQKEQERHIQARNEHERQKLVLARAIGLPLAQSFTLANALPDESPVAGNLEDFLARAYDNRSDAKAATARVHAAAEAVRAAKSENLPTVHVDANYGVIGPSVTNSHGTFAIAGSVKIPIFNPKYRGDVMEKEAFLAQRRSEAGSLLGRIELEVRSALLEVQSAEEQLKLARSGLTLVRQQLDQAQDRFAAGITSNLEVVQAQESLSLADDSVIAGLYQFNVARAALARAMGVAEQSVGEFFGGNPRP